RVNAAAYDRLPELVTRNERVRSPRRNMLKPEIGETHEAIEENRGFLKGNGSSGATVGSISEAHQARGDLCAPHPIGVNAVRISTHRGFIPIGGSHVDLDEGSSRDDRSALCRLQHHVLFGAALQ